MVHLAMLVALGVFESLRFFPTNRQYPFGYLLVLQQYIGEIKEE